jgi:hypothetical protein
MKVKGWGGKMTNREEWRLTVQEAKAHPELKRRGVGRKDLVRQYKIWDLFLVDGLGIFHHVHINLKSYQNSYRMDKEVRNTSPIISILSCAYLPLSRVRYEYIGR